MKIVNIDGENLYLLRDLWNFNDIFRKDATYNNIKIKKKQGFIPSLKDTFLEKPEGGGVKLTTHPPSPAF